MTYCITGASSGLGWELSLLLARPGITITICGRNEEKLNQLAMLIESRGGKAFVCVADLATDGGIEAVSRKFEECIPSVLIHNAGIGRYGDFIDVPIQESMDILNVNVVAPMRLTHAWCLACRAAKMSGTVVFIDSVAAFFPMASMATYAASKSFLLSFAEGLRWELASHRVLTVCPGSFTSSFQENAARRPQSPQHTSAVEVAKEIVKLLRKEKSGVHVLGMWKWLKGLASWVPMRWWMPFVKKEIASRLR